LSSKLYLTNCSNIYSFPLPHLFFLSPGISLGKDPARRYHSEITLLPLMAKSTSIALFQPPPAWALVSSVDSDRVLLCQKWMRKEYGLATTTLKLNRHQHWHRKRLWWKVVIVDYNRSVDVAPQRWWRPHVIHQQISHHCIESRS
jgi:hypothetical protein